MTEWPKSVLEYERLTVADRTVEWNDKAEVAFRDLKKMVRKRDKMLEEAWRRCGQAWSWPKDEWLDYIALRVEEREYGGDDD